ncbi:hypothetical protein BJ322DRAFT_1108700 [Thelephora terrestris]|uniref:NACHT domain-containing protein n=1 Tax=Thelephora terrestris TaxID=56493 RepID=A0A9P6HDZ9_9AGAM|nr:hypothetical protein BJ322DRAFT_1108700 [Thelephora terrestris]
MLPFWNKSSSSTRPTNSPPPTPTPPVVEPVKQGLPIKHTKAKDLSVLAASATAIALSVASPSCSPMDTALDEPGPSKESCWKTAYEAAKIAIDIANASSDMCLPLKAVVGALSVLIKNYDQSADNADQIREIEERVESLSEILASPVGDRDDKEKARRVALRRKLTRVFKKLRPLSKQHGIVKFLKNADHSKTLNSFVQDLATAVTDYQTSIQQDIYGNTKKIGEDIQKIIEAADLKRLEELGPVHNAGHQAGHHDLCLPGTREAVLDRIMRWTKNPQERRVFWLNGLAGTGKSTIAQTFSGMVADAGALGASFFCSRDYLDRKELKHIFPTLAYQLACRYPAFRERIIRVIKQDPSVARNSLISQLKGLIVDPLSATSITCVIVVDALDECVDDQPASAILSVLGRHVKDLPSVKFFITGRPEPRIRTGFRLPLLEPITQTFLLHEVEPSNVDKDIRLYLQEKLTAIAKGRSDLDVSDPWPRDCDLTTLTKKSSGLFIFASTLARFIESEHHEPDKRLQLIINQPDCTAHEGVAGIDPLYTQVLELAFSGIEETEMFTNLRRVLGTVVLAFNPLSREQIAQMLGVDVPHIKTTLRHLHSVLIVPEDDSKEIRVFHKSFPDFLQDPHRCSDPKFLIDTPTHHGQMALGCLELLKKLKLNPCDLPDFVMNRDVPDISGLLEEKVGGATRYACSYWAMHVRSSPTTGNYVLLLITSATEFFNTNGVQWIEVMSLENRLESVVHSINHLFDWFGMVDTSTPNLHNLAEDYLRFTKNFFHLIQQSAPHIYHSALPLSPRSSMFRPMILWEKTPITGVYGCPDTWGAALQTIQTGSVKNWLIATSDHWIAAAQRKRHEVVIHDAITGALRLLLRLEDSIVAVGGFQDGTIVLCGHSNGSVTLWDTQTGGLARTFALKNKARIKSVAISMKGRFLACLFENGMVEVLEVAKKGKNDGIWEASPVTCFCWLRLEEQLAVAGGVWVQIWDVVAGTTLRSFTTVELIFDMVYSQELDRLAVATRGSFRTITVIIDLQKGKSSVLLQEPEWLDRFAFSRTAEEIVGSMMGGGLGVFSLSTQRWRYYKLRDTVNFISSLPNGAVVVGARSSGIQLLSMDDRYAQPPQPTLVHTVTTLDQGRIIALRLEEQPAIQLLETSTMSNLFTLSDDLKGYNIGNDFDGLVAASLKNRMVVYCLVGSGGGEYMQSCGLGDKLPIWTVKIDSVPSEGKFSPAGTRLVTIHFHGPWFERTSSSISVWDAGTGKLQAAKILFGPYIPSPYITFDSETRFHSEYCTYNLELSPGAETTHQISFLSSYRAMESSESQYQVDRSREWVVRGSEKICWIPPGYLSSRYRGHHWAGPNTLVMLGEDRVLRKLTFRS